MQTYSKYQDFINILDCLRREAPSQYKLYHALDRNTEEVNQARSRAYIHLYLKVKFGLLTFTEREHYVTDRTQDGGVDAYYIDRENRKIYFLQSKFRVNEKNFEAKQIGLEELLNMDLDRITKGLLTDELGNNYCGKIRQLQREMSEIPDIGRYTFEVIILANLKHVRPDQLNRLTGGFPTVIFDFKRTYEDLVFPIISGTYYNQPELSITINLTNKSSSYAKLSYTVFTTFKPCDITLVFVPTIEIGRILFKYKNSILKFNPRSYLELSNNTVNKDIAATIYEKSTNEFALFNNGITMLWNGP